MLNRRSLIGLVLAALLPLAVRADDTVTRMEIQRVLDSMAAACVAGDAAGYLAHVDKEDKEFLQEQTYFANDAHRASPAQCTLALGEEELKIGDGTAEGELITTWNMPEKKEREVRFRARFVKAEGDWRYAGETWQRLEQEAGRGKVLVMYDDGLEEIAAKTVEAFAAVREGVEAGFELQQEKLPLRTQKIKLYKTMKHLQASICLAYEDGLSGWNEPGESVKLLASPRSTVSGLKRLLAHEYGHVATFELGPKSNSMPWWVLEGVAELSADALNSAGTRAQRSAIRMHNSNTIAPWNELADFHTVPDKWRGNVYSQGHAMVAYIAERYGRTACNNWMRSMSGGASVDAATREVLSLPFDDLDAQWRESVAKAAEEQKKQEAAKEAEKAADGSKENAPATEGSGGG